jgi:molybdenum cofactor cytidylyltransferase
MSRFVSGLVLAAGTSTRLGRPKQLLPWRGTTLLEWVVRQAEDSPLREVLVVLGHEAEKIRQVVNVRRAKLVTAADFNTGCTASIRAGLDAIAAGADAAMLLLADQPGLQTKSVAGVISAWEKMQKPVVRVSYRGVLGHPMIFDKELFTELKALHDDKGVWKLLDAHPDWVGEFELDQPFPGDINTWDDFARLGSGSAAG